jgi:hypothetical protein
MSIIALGSTRPLTEMSTRNIPGGKGRPARKANNLSPFVSRLSRVVFVNCRAAARYLALVLYKKKIYWVAVRQRLRTTIKKVWEPRRLTTLWASAACYRDSFALFLFQTKCMYTSHVFLIIDSEFLSNQF